MNGYSRRDRKSGDAKLAGLSRSPLLCLPIQSKFFGHGKNQELLLPSASDCAGSGAIAKDQRRRLDEARLARFNHSADLSTHRRKNSVRTTRATAVRTSVNPLRVDRCSTLVTAGLYRFSRNPMYLGLVLALLGWAIVLGNVLCLLLVWAFARTLEVLQIKPEESALLKTFGKVYSDYTHRVNRWIGWRDL